MSRFVKAAFVRTANYLNGASGSRWVFQERPASLYFSRSGLSASQSYCVTAGASMELRYRVPHLSNVEDVEQYRRGGYHPIHLGDSLEDGRYRILHKLGYGGFSTVWLARDGIQDRLVSLKVLTADASRPATELKLLRLLDEHAQANPGRGSIIAPLDDFTIHGPNGTHLCYTSQLGGPSLSALWECPGQVAGTHRLRASLARKLARQLVKAVSLMHDAGIVHGDITPKNVLLQMNGLDVWSEEAVYQQLGRPIMEQIFKSSGQKPDEMSPEYLVEPASFSGVDMRYLSEHVLLIDLGESFLDTFPPPNGVGTPLSYRSPELIMESAASRASDIWALACTLFEIRSGFPLFESFVGSSTEILEEIVRIMGAPPMSSHLVWQQHGVYIADCAQPDGPIIYNRVKEIGVCDGDWEMPNIDDDIPNYNLLLEPSDNSITEEEVIDLTDLLRRALAYTPEARLSAKEIFKHSWFARNEPD